MASSSLTSEMAGQTQARWQLLSVVSDVDWTVPAAADRLGTSRQAILLELDGLDLARIRADLRQLACAVRARLDDAGRDRA